MCHENFQPASTRVLIPMHQREKYCRLLRISVTIGAAEVSIMRHAATLLHGSTWLDLACSIGIADNLFYFDINEEKFNSNFNAK